MCDILPALSCTLTCHPSSCLLSRHPWPLCWTCCTKDCLCSKLRAACWLQQTWVLIVGLLGWWVLWEWVIYLLLINSCNCDPLIDNLPNIIEQVWSLWSFCTCLLACCKSASPAQSVNAKVWVLLLAIHMIGGHKYASDYGGALIRLLSI